MKWLKVAVVAMFVLMVAVGVTVLFFFPGKMGEFKELVNTLFPVFLAQVIPALIGRPLTDYIQAQAKATIAKAGVFTETVEEASHEGVL